MWAGSEQPREHITGTRELAPTGYRPASEIILLSKTSSEIMSGTIYNPGERYAIEGLQGRGDKEAIATIIEPRGASFALSTEHAVAYNACCSMWASGQTVCTTNQLWQQMTGATRRPTEKQRTELESRLRGLARPYIDMDYRFELRGKKTSEGTLWDARLLPVDVRRCNTRNGAEVTVWVLTGEPALLTHDKDVHQITACSAEVISALASAMPKITWASLVLRDALLARLARAKGGNVKVRYTWAEGLWPIGAHVSRDKEAVRDTLIRMLAALADIGEIAGWDEVGKGASRGVQIARKRRS